MSPEQTDTLTTLILTVVSFVVGLFLKKPKINKNEDVENDKN